MIAIIGAGGIGSMFCREFCRMIKHSQFNGIRIESIHVFDDDIVEPSNLRHQDYTTDDLSAPKAWVMHERYGFTAVPRRFVEADLTDYTEYIICADNPAVRTLVYKHARQFDKFFIDMRAEGVRIAVFTPKEDAAILDSTLGPEPESEEGRSCQIAVDNEQNHIQLGNASVAPLGLQILMLKHREEEYPKSIMEDITGVRTVRT